MRGAGKCNVESIVASVTAARPKAPDPLLALYEKIGEATAVGRATGHAVNGISQKVDGLDGKVDALALVVAAQGHLREDVARLESALTIAQGEISVLKADSTLREGERKGVINTGKAVQIITSFLLGSGGVLAVLELMK